MLSHKSSPHLRYSSKKALIVYKPDIEVSGNINLSTVYELIVKTLELLPYYDPIINLLGKHKSLSKESGHYVHIYDLQNVLDDPELHEQLPIVVQGREIDTNVKIIKASIAAITFHFLTLEEIKEALNVFWLVERDYEGHNIPLKYNSLLSTLTLLNKTISKKVLKYWIEECGHLLEWTQEQAKKEKMESAIDMLKDLQDLSTDGREPRIYPHEFIYLLCNCESRGEMLTGIEEKVKTTIVNANTIHQTPETGSINPVYKLSWGIGRHNKFFEVSQELKYFKLPDKLIQTHLNAEIGDVREEYQLEGLKYLQTQQNKRVTTKNREELFKSLEDPGVVPTINEEEFVSKITGTNFQHLIEEQRIKCNSYIHKAKLAGDLNLQLKRRLINRIIEHETQPKPRPSQQGFSMMGFLSSLSQLGMGSSQNMETDQRAPVFMGKFIKGFKKSKKELKTTPNFIHNNKFPMTENMHIYNKSRIRESREVMEKKERELKKNRGNKGNRGNNIYTETEDIRSQGIMTQTHTHTHTHTARPQTSHQQTSTTHPLGYLTRQRMDIRRHDKIMEKCMTNFVDAQDEFYNGMIPQGDNINMHIKNIQGGGRYSFRDTGGSSFPKLRQKVVNFDKGHAQTNFRKNLL